MKRTAPAPPARSSPAARPSGCRPAAPSPPDQVVEVDRGRRQGVAKLSVEIGARAAGSGRRAHGPPQRRRPAPAGLGHRTGRRRAGPRPRPSRRANRRSASRSGHRPIGPQRRPAQRPSERRRAGQVERFGDGAVRGGHRVEFLQAPAAEYRRASIDPRSVAPARGTWPWAAGRHARARLAATARTG
jgi:hypothetical protein